MCYFHFEVQGRGGQLGQQLAIWETCVQVLALLCAENRARSIRENLGVLGVTVYHPWWEAALWKQGGMVDEFHR